MLPQAIALLAAISYDPLYFGAVVAVVGLLCVVFYLALPTITERPVWKRAALGYFIAGGAFEASGLLLVLYALSFGPVVMVTQLTATLPLWVVIGGKLFLRDVEKITPRIIIGALLVVCGSIAIAVGDA